MPPLAALFLKVFSCNEFSPQCVGWEFALAARALCVPALPLFLPLVFNAEGFPGALETPLGLCQASSPRADFKKG